MSGGRGSDVTTVDEADVEFDDATLHRIRERVLQAEKEKLHLDYPRGIVNDIEEIVREEVR
jgi:hypothetical protein